MDRGMTSVHNNRCHEGGRNWRNEREKEAIRAECWGWRDGGAFAALVEDQS